MTLELVAIGTAGIVLGLVAGVAISRRMAIARIRGILGTARAGALGAAERALAEERARSEERARLDAEDLVYLTGLVGSGILRLDEDLVVTSANRAAHVYLDVPQGELVGRRVPSRPGGRPDDPGGGDGTGLGDVRLDAVARTALRNGAAADEIPVGGADGRTIAIRARRSPREGIWVVLEDLSELRRLQRIRTEFIDNLSHELRTPLTTVRLLTETLARDLEEMDVPDRVVDVVEKIDVETGHLVQMATELLDLAKIEQGSGPPLYIDDVPVAPVVRSAIDRLALFAERQGVRLRAEIDPDVPTVLGDPERLGQMLINLVHNAIKFSPGGGDVIVRARHERAPAAEEQVLGAGPAQVGTQSAPAETASVPRDAVSAPAGTSPVLAGTQSALAESPSFPADAISAPAGTRPAIAGSPLAAPGAAPIATPAQAATPGAMPIATPAQAATPGAVPIAASTVAAPGSPLPGPAGTVVLEVEDHGVGIPAADVPRVFERFYKVDKARVRGGGGTGLGLAIVRHIAEDHGGEVSVESVEGVGSTFRVRLPAAPPVPSGSPRPTA